jgi:hypothetical protein
MPLNPVVHTRSALLIAQDQVIEVCSRTADTWQLASDGRGVLGMIPTYCFPAKRLAKNEWNKGWRSGWRYYWTHPEIEWGIIIDIRSKRRKGAQLASIVTSPFVAKQWEKLQNIEKEFSTSRRRYRPRYLRLPWINLEAIWLNTDSLRVPDKFYDVTEQLQNEEFRRAAVSRAKALLMPRTGR